MSLEMQEFEKSLLASMTATDKKPKNSALNLNGTGEPLSAFIDPGNVLDYVGTRAKPGSVGYALLRSMAIRAKPVAAIILTRQNQVARFTRRPAYKGDTGFKLKLKEVDREPTDAERKRMLEIEEGILRTGFVENMKRKDNFNTFVRKLIRDSLVLDAMAFEPVFNRKGELVEWWAVDGATIEVVTEMATYNQTHPIVYEPITDHGRKNAGELAYVQRINGIVTAEYRETELAYSFRNPRTDLDYALFGMSELEVLIETVTNMLNAETYNGAYFSHSHLPQGILEIVGKYQQEHLESFRRAWKTLTSGSVGKWRVPIMALEEGQGLKFTPFKQSSKDMEYHQWLEFLTTMACAVYQIDPTEIGMKSWSGGNNAGMRSEAEASRIDHSMDKGFIPLMFFLSDTINSELVNRIDPMFEFDWVGLNEADEKQKSDDRDKRLLSGYTTVNEERRAEDQPSIEDMMIEAGVDAETAKKMGLWGFAPANATLNQVFMNTIQQQQAAEQAEQQAEMGLGPDGQPLATPQQELKNESLPQKTKTTVRKEDFDGEADEETPVKEPKLEKGFEAEVVDFEIIFE